LKIAVLIIFRRYYATAYPGLSLVHYLLVHLISGSLQLLSPNADRGTWPAAL